MSIDTPTADEVDRTPALPCGVCGAGADPSGRLLAWYATDGAEVPAFVTEDSLLGLCGRCDTEVRELTDAWNGIDQPTVGAERSIAESYAETADACSFCDDALDEDSTALGLEAWTPGHPARLDHDDHAHHVLCGTCIPIFAEFLRGLCDDS